MNDDRTFGCFFALIVVITIVWISVLIWLAITGINYLQSEIEKNEDAAQYYEIS